MPPKRKSTSTTASATKKVIVSAAASDDESEDDTAMREEVVKGRAAVDIEFPGKEKGVPRSDRKEDYHVLDSGGTVYDTMLNQTNIAKNANKFYIVQVLESDAGGGFVSWARWGRVGEHGQSSIIYRGPSQEGAISTYERKVKDKSKKYTILERDYGGGGAAAAASAGGGGKKGSAKGKAKAKAIPKSKLKPKVQDFVNLIADISMMEEQMTKLGYDAKKLPLGKLSKTTIEAGYEVLKDIAKLLNASVGKPSQSQLQELSSKFYTVVPHSFGRSVPPVIKTKAAVKNKLEMCQSLADIVVAQTILKSVQVTENPIDACFEKLKIEMTPMKKASKEFKLLQEYVKNTHGATHTNYALEIDEAFVIAREGEEERFKPFEADANRQLLWHGSRLSNFIGILSQGLRIAPPEAPVTGYMFDKGVYFADCVSKSANYCWPSGARGASTSGVMLLCEVALGEMEEMTKSNYYANRARMKAGKQSVKGVGKCSPVDAGAKTVADGVKVPCGKIEEDVDDASKSLMYNEYIVYDTAQIKMRYALKMKFSF